MNAIIEHEEPSALRGDERRLAMLQQAIASGATVETLDKLFAMQERWETQQARRAFDRAIAAAKPEIPVIGKNRVGHNSKRYADFAAIAAVVDPIIGKHGLSYRFRSQQTDKISVTCILSHEAGHYEETMLSGPADTTGSKNAIQAIGSTLSYLQRYTLVQALGLATAEDDDGHAAGLGDDGPITDMQAASLRGLIEETNTDIAKFCEWARVDAVPQILASQLKRAMDFLEAKKRKMAQ